MESKIFAKYFLLSVIIVLGIYIFSLLKQYAVPIILAFILAFLFAPLYNWIFKLVKKKWIAASFVIIIIGLILIIPSAYISYSVVSEAEMFISTIGIETTGNYVMDIQNFASDRFNVKISDENAQKIVNLISEKVFPFIKSLLPKILTIFSNLGIKAFILVFLLYYLLINKEIVIKKLEEYLPFTKKNSKMLLGETANNTKALVYGQGIVALIQGTLGAVGFIIFGINGVFLWGFIMTILSFIPVMGAFLVWFPAGVIMIIQGNYFSGIGILAWGIIIVSNVDNIIRPKLISSMAKLHPIVVLLGVFIGIKEFHLLGIIIGPLLISTLLILIRLFEEEYIIKKKKN